MTTARHQLDLAMTEAQWQATVIDLASTLGWIHYHVHDSRRSHPGFPDLCLVRDRVIFAELKSMRGRLSTHQIAWQRLLDTARAEAYVWRPSDWPQVEQTLTRRARP
jgi:hypothetical protein